MEIAQISMVTPIGRIFLQASGKGLRSISWKPEKVPSVTRLDKANPTHRHLAAARDQLQSYFSGRRKDFDIRLDLQGTPFQLKVWAELRKLKFGATTSYLEIAKRIGSPKAMRAVGSANGKNPICIIVPCHRVIAANGTLGGYSGLGGLQTKKKLLQLENAL